ncbi:hypothetical protein IV102_31590 [bacterium]|nr:hypothetical protein [bacterium]
MDTTRLHLGNNRLIILKKPQGDSVMLNPQIRKNLEIARNLSRLPVLRPELVVLGPTLSDNSAPCDIFVPRDPSLDRLGEPNCSVS